MSSPPYSLSAILSTGPAFLSHLDGVNRVLDPVSGQDAGIDQDVGVDLLSVDRDFRGIGNRSVATMGGKWPLRSSTQMYCCDSCSLDIPNTQLRLLP